MSCGPGIPATVQGQRSYWQGEPSQLAQIGADCNKPVVLLDSFLKNTDQSSSCQEQTPWVWDGVEAHGGGAGIWTLRQLSSKPGSQDAVSAWGWHQDLAAEKTAAFRSSHRGWLADAILGRLFPGRTLQDDLDLSEDGHRHVRPQRLKGGHEWYSRDIGWVVF